MAFDFLTEDSKRAWARAVEEANDRGHDAVACGHVLLVLLRDADEPCTRLLSRLGVDVGLLRADVDEILGRRSPAREHTPLAITHGFKWTLEEAIEMAARLDQPRVDPPHLLGGMARALDPLERGTLRGRFLRVRAGSRDRAAGALCRAVGGPESIERELAAMRNESSDE